MSIFRSLLIICIATSQLESVLSQLTTTRRADIALPTGVSENPSLADFPPVRVDKQQTQTHVLIEDSTGRGYPVWNPYGELFNFLNQLQRDAKEQRDAPGGNTPIPSSWRYNLGPGVNWQWSLTKYKLQLTWNDVISVVDALFTNAFNFFRATKGFCSLQVRVGRIGTAHPEEEDALAIVFLWYGTPRLSFPDTIPEQGTDVSVEK